jgi:hypothetical protein
MSRGMPLALKVVTGGYMAGREQGLRVGRLEGFVWAGAVACAAGAVAWIAVDLLAWSRELFLVPYVLTGCMVGVLFVREAGSDFSATLRHRPLRTALVAGITAGLMIGTVMLQPGAPRAAGGRLALELAWDGLAYGAMDGLLLTVIPIAAVRRSLGPARWSHDALALLASVMVFIVYHLGFPEFRGSAIGAPVVAAIAFGAAYLVARNPLAPTLAHAAMHVAAVLHGPAGTVQLPPHY